MGEGKGSRAEAEENDVSSSPKEDRGGAESKVGEGEARGVEHRERGGEGVRLRLQCLPNESARTGAGTILFKLAYSRQYLSRALDMKSCSATPGATTNSRS
jgi:hypothetical protein